MSAHPLIDQVFKRLTSKEINRLCRRANIDRPTVNAWLREDRTPRLDLFTAIADAAGYNLTLTPKGSTKMLRVKKQINIVNRNKRIEAFEANQLVAYVEDDTLFAIDAKGYASEIGPIAHRVEIAGKLIEWRAKQNGGASIPQAS